VSLRDRRNHNMTKQCVEWRLLSTGEAAAMRSLEWRREETRGPTIANQPISLPKQ